MQVLTLVGILAFGTTCIAASLSGCAVTTTGVTKDDTTLSGETTRLAEAGAKYSGPEYLVGLITFENRTPSRVLGIGEAATTILRTLLEQAGLKAILLDGSEIRDQEWLRELQRADLLKPGRKQLAEGFDAPDYRLSGAITAYSEVEEGIDVVVRQRKTRLARVTVDYALVDVATGRALVSGSGAGEYRKETTGAFGLGAQSTYDPNMRDAALRDALAKALNNMLAKLSGQPFRGLVLLVEDNSIVIRAGTRSQLKEGTELNVYRPGAEIRDPQTGQLYGHRESRIGVIRIDRHENERLSEASVISGQGFRSGDSVRVGP